MIRKQAFQGGSVQGTGIKDNSTFLFTLVFDDRCPLVRHLANIVRHWDTNKNFKLVSNSLTSKEHSELVSQLNHLPWSLLLVDNQNNQWTGPEAIPIILKNLPFGKLAAVLYIIPGTMWLTRRIYNLISRNRQVFVEQLNS
jgi:predicted DCC family thiol-disulfide oxidoreductase YuxK